MSRGFFVSCLIVVGACAGGKQSTHPTAAPPNPEVVRTPSPFDNAAVAATDRSDADRALDAGRKPTDFLAFTEVAPGQRVADLISGGGYTTELLARVVGKDGAVYAQNPPSMVERMGKMIDERYTHPAMAQVHRGVRDSNDPLPPDAAPLDLVVINLNYHDLVWQKVDRDAMNRAVYAALKPGGHYVVCDSSAKDGSGDRDVKTLHRIDEKLVKDEVAKAGFQLEEESNLYRNPADPRDWNSSPRAAGERRGTSDRFLLRFVKR